MRPNIHALVLGNRSTTEVISAQLAEAGVRPIVYDGALGALPSLADPNAAIRLREILARFQADAPEVSGASHLVHPGTTCWADRTELPVIAQELSLTAVVPPSRTLARFQNQLNLLEEAEKMGVPNLLLRQDPMSTLREVESLAKDQHSFPVVLRAIKAEGALGSMTLRDVREIESRLPLWQEQLRRNFGEVILFAERQLEEARRIRVPFCRQPKGTLKLFPHVDISLQFRHRDLIQLCPAEGFTSVVTKKLDEWTALLAEKLGYVGVGSFEFIVDGDRVFLSRGNAKLDSAFELWGKMAGTQAVRWQLSSLPGYGELASSEAGSTESYGMLFQLWAEDSILQLPRPGWAHEVGTLREWNQPSARARMILEVEEGRRIDPRDSGWIGTISVFAKDRKQAFLLARGALCETWIAGPIQTNERFLSEIISHPWVSEGIYHGGFLDEEFLPSLRPSVETLRAFPAVLADLVTDSVRWAVGDQWVQLETDSVTWVEGPRIWRWGELRGISGMARLSDGMKHRVCAFPVGEKKWQVRIGLWVLGVRAVSVVPGRKAKPEPKVSALVSGRVHSVLFREGSVVPAHECFLTMESLGTLVPHALPVDARITRWLVGAEESVEAGEVLAEFEILSKN